MNSNPKRKVPYFETIRKRDIYFFMVMALLFTVVSSTYSPVLYHFFLADDASWILHSQSIGNTLKPINGYLRPATVLYFFIMQQVFIHSPLPYHGMNIFVHFLNTVLLFFLSRELKKFFGWSDDNSSRGLLQGLPSFFAAGSFCFFAAIIWVSSIHDLFMTTFILCSLLFLLKGMAGFTHACKFLPCYTFYFIALLFKEHAIVTVAAAFPLIFFHPLPRKLKRGIFAGYVAITVLYAVFYRYFNTDPNIGSVKLGWTTLQNLAVLSAEAVVSFFGYSFHPRIRESPHPVIFYWAQAGSLISFVFIVICGVYAKIHTKRNRMITWGMYFFVVCLLPVCFLSYVSNPLDAFSARYRYFYLPIFGLSLSLSAFLESFVYGARPKVQVLTRMACFLFLSCVLLMNVQLNHVPIRDYGGLSEINTSLIQKIILAYNSTKWNKVIVVDDFPSHAVIPLALPHYLQLYTNKTFTVRWFSSQEFSRNRDVSLVKDSIFIVAWQNQFADKTKELEKFIKGMP